jgi:hypothetical protein
MESTIAKSFFIVLHTSFHGEINVIYLMVKPSQFKPPVVEPLSQKTKFTTIYRDIWDTM